MKKNEAREGKSRATRETSAVSSSVSMQKSSTYDALRQDEHRDQPAPTQITGEQNV